MKRFLPFIIIAIIFTANTGCSKKVVTSETALGHIPQKAAKPDEQAAKAEMVKDKETATVTTPVEVPSTTAEAMKSQKEAATVTAPVEVPSTTAEAMKSQEEAVAVTAPVEVPSTIAETMKSQKEAAAVTTPVEVPSITAEAMKSQEEAAAVTTPVEVLKLRDIFFGFDSFTIREEARSILEANREYLKANKDSKILIQGHCDERGTSEYNMALGERRAQSAKKYLIDLGIDPSRISTISYGKEKPFCTDHNEECWQENRRAHFAIK